jgi:hypothetical protein
LLLGVEVAAHLHQGPMADVAPATSSAPLAQALFADPDILLQTSRPTTSTSTPFAGSRAC